MFKKILDNLKKIGLLGFLSLCLHPVITPLFIFFSWPISLWNSRLLFQGQWSKYQGFDAKHAINSLFYRTQWINIDRYGRRSISPVLGLGNYPLKMFWHLSNFSSYFYSHAGAISILIGTFIMVLSHLFWLQEGNLFWVLIVTGILFFSSTSYLMAFALQNYQILSWMLLPITFYGLINGYYVVAAAFLLISSSLGITAFIFSFFSIGIFVAQSGTYAQIFIIIPACIMVIIKLVFIFYDGDIWNSFLMIGKLIGLIKKDVQYKRKSMKIGLFNLYFMVLYGIGIVLLWYFGEKLPVFPITAFFIFIINQTFMRVADHESVITFFLIMTGLEVMQMPYNWLILCPLVLICNPLPGLLGSGKNFLATLPSVYSPFDSEPLLRKIRFFLDLPKKSKVFFAFNSPNGVYENIFDGYRHLLEAAFLVGTEQEIHLFPDWYAVAQTNYPEAPSIWGRNPESVKQNMNRWNADYVIIYQDSNTDLSAEWVDDFTVVNSIDWNIVFPDLKKKRVISESHPTPKWWLLKYK